jgi:hypothetical protein
LPSACIKGSSPPELVALGLLSLGLLSLGLLSLGLITLGLQDRTTATPAPHHLPFTNVHKTCCNRIAQGDASRYQSPSSQSPSPHAPAATAKKSAYASKYIKLKPYQLLEINPYPSL